MKELGNFIFSAGAVVVILLVTAGRLRANARGSTSARALLIVAIAYGFASVYLVDYALGRLLIAGFHPLRAADVPAGKTAVVVLGSSSVTAPDWDGAAYSTVDREGAARVREAFRVFQLVHPDWIISSGGSPIVNDPSVPAGNTMRDALVQLGVPASQILVETRSTDTHDEAVVLAALLPPLHVDHVVLVTSEIHMRRSMGTFRSQGIDAIPAIAREPFVPRSWLMRVLPSQRGLEEASAVAHEVAGIAIYTARGWYRF